MVRNATQIVARFGKGRLADSGNIQYPTLEFTALLQKIHFKQEGETEISEYTYSQQAAQRVDIYHLRLKSRTQLYRQN